MPMEAIKIVKRAMVAVTAIIGIVIVGAALGTAIRLSREPGWVTVNTPDGICSIRFPAQPEMEIGAGPKLWPASRMRSYRVELQGGSYQMDEITINGEINNETAASLAALTSEEIGGELTMTATASDFRIKLPAGLIVRGKIHVEAESGKVFRLLAVRPAASADSGDSAEVKLFFESLSIR